MATVRTVMRPLCRVGGVAATASRPTFAPGQLIDMTAPDRSQRMTASSAAVGSETQPAVPPPVSTWKKIADPRPGVRASL